MMQYIAARRVLTTGLLAGLAGGLAEVAWIAIYAALTAADAGAVARGVSDTLVGQTALPVLNGLGIHMSLAALLGIGIASALQAAGPRLRGISEYVAVLAVLTAVWAVNFFVVLPLINPQFVQLVPYAASLISKLLFGLAAAWTFRAARALCLPSLCGS